MSSMGAMRAQSTRTALDMSDDEQTTGGAGRRGGPTGVSARRQAADIRGFMARDAAPVQKKVNEPEGAQTEQAPAAQTEFKPADPRGKIAALHPGMQSKARALIEQAHARGLNIWIVDGVRTFAQQDALYAKGRTAPGNIVTKVKGGGSYHNYGLAVDVVFHGGSGPWGEEHDWAGLGAAGVAAGLEWGGNWSGFKDRPHFQMPGLRISTMKQWHANGGMEKVWAEVTRQGGGSGGDPAMEVIPDDGQGGQAGGQTGGQADAEGFDLAAAVRFNSKQGYPADQWERIQGVVGAGVDGKPGSNTARKVFAWQGQNGLEADGKVGSTTLAAINRSGGANAGANTGAAAGANAGATGGAVDTGPAPTPAPTPAPQNDAEIDTPMEPVGGETQAAPTGIVGEKETSQNLRLRSAPSLSGDVVTVLNRGAKVTQLEGETAADGYTWVPVRQGALNGYCAKQYLIEPQPQGSGVTNESGETPPGGEPGTALVVPPERQRPVDLREQGLRWQTQMSDNYYRPSGTSQSAGCFYASKHMADSFMAGQGETSRIAGSNDILRIGQSEDNLGRLQVDPQAAFQGVNEIDAMLDAGRPVVVGVSHKDANYNVDQLTDHFVCIFGRSYGANGVLSYGFFDPGTGQSSKSASAFQVDAATYKLYREGNLASGYVVDRRYEVSMVRRYTAG